MCIYRPKFVGKYRHNGYPILCILNLVITKVFCLHPVFSEILQMKIWSWRTTSCSRVWGLPVSPRVTSHNYWNSFRMRRTRYSTIQVSTRDRSSPSSTLTGGSHTLHTGSDSKSTVLICHTATKSTNAVTLQPPEQEQPHTVATEASSGSSLIPVTRLCLTWTCSHCSVPAGLLTPEVWGGNEQISSQISRSTDNPPSIRHSSKCPWLSHLSTLLSTFRSICYF